MTSPDRPTSDARGDRAGLTARVRAHRLTICVLMLPVLIGSLVVWSLADRAEQTTQVPAAVVNLDEPVLEKGEPPVAAGRLLAAGLTSPRTEAAPPEAPARQVALAAEAAPAVVEVRTPLWRLVSAASTDSHPGTGPVDWGVDVPRLIAN